MRFGLSWLKEYVDVDVSPEELKDLLNFSGTKVETMERPGAEIEGVVAAEVLNIARHPNADSLSLVDVRWRGGEEQRVVCGAKNFKVGDLVPLARVGARLPGVEITERKIRGEISRGMLCSGAELGVSKDDSGILILPPEVTLGADVVGALGLDDVIYELEVTPNRGDCMSLIGVAREVAALVGKELRLPEVHVPASDVANPVEVQIDDPAGCSRYIARYIDGITIGPSPAWMARRLLAAGIRPISNAVDVTNYVLLETGQPLHAFDARQITDDKIVVRRAKPGEKLTTLDGIERQMRHIDLLICDPKRPLAIAGVMGGEDSEVSDDTTALILEVARFDPSSVSQTSRDLGLLTEASARFERGVDPEGVAFAAARACMLFAELAEGRISPEVVDEYPPYPERLTISLRPSRTEHLLGYEIPSDDQIAHLRAVGFEVEAAGNVLKVEVPTFRPDVEREVDLIEEVARLEGFDKLPVTLPRGHSGGLDPAQIADRRVRQLLSGVGMAEAWTPSLVSPKDVEDLRLPEDHPARRAVALSNPMSEDESVLRTTILPGLLRSVARNVAQRAGGVALYELARIYEPSDADLPQEADVLAAVFTGLRTGKHWRDAGRRWDLFSVKGVLEALFTGLRLEAPRFRPVTGDPFHPTRAAAVSLNGTALGALGEIHPEVCERFDVPEGSVAFEIAVAPIVAALPPRPQVAELGRYPAIYLDLAFVVDAGVPSEKIGDLIAKSGEPEVTKVELFDVYTGEQVPAGKKSLAFALELRVPGRTLTDEDAGVVRDRILGAVGERTGAKLRA